jgi:O-antigen/teichoic acid export membrane protein
MPEDFSKFIRGFSITSAGVVYTSLIFYGSALLAVNLLGPTKYGLFSLAFMVPNVAICFLFMGLDVTTARYIAHNLGEQNEEKAIRCAQTIFLVRICVAVLSFCVFFLLSEPLARLLGEDITTGLQVLSLYISAYLVARYLMAVLQGYFLIKERTITEVLVNTLNFVLLIPLVYLGFGYLSPILSFLFAFLFSIVLSLYYLERAGIPVFRIRFEGIAALKEYLKFSFYVYLSDSFHTTYTWVGIVVIKIYSMPVETVGYYRAMFSITNAILIISYGLTIVLYPMLSELNARKEYERLSFSLRKVMKYTLALSIPAALGMLLLSQPLVFLLFPKYGSAVTLLKILSFRMIFLPLWSVLATALLTLGMAKKQVLFALFLSGFSFVLSSGLGIFSVEGIAVANTISLVVTVMLQYWVLKRHTHIDAGPVLKFCFSSAVMCVVVWLILQCSLGGVAEVVLSLVCGIVVYSLCVLKVGAVLPEDIDLMRSALSAFGRFGKAFEPLLDLAQRVIEL